jgi:hypothetical protein
VNAPNIEHPKKLRVLCYVNHYYWEHSKVGTDGFIGKSLGYPRELRTKTVERAYASLKRLAAHPRIERMDIQYCGFPGKSIRPIDFDLSYIVNPSLCAYESLTRMREQIGEYDYFLNIEDDIEVNPHIFTNILEFDSETLDNQCFLPNRYEVKDGKRIFADILLNRGWTTQELNFRGKRLRVALNPHASLMFLKASKYKYATDRIDLSFRGKVIGRAGASAYAHFHKPLSLFRSYDDPYFHSVQHLDHYVPYWTVVKENKWQKAFSFLRRKKHQTLAVNSGAIAEKGVELMDVPDSDDVDIFSF